MPEEYEMLSETLQFDKSEAALELNVKKDEAQRKGWMIALVSKKVSAVVLKFSYIIVLLYIATLIMIISVMDYNT